MREFSSEFSTYMRQETTSLCWGWLLDLNDGRQLAFCDHDEDVRIGNVLFHASSGFIPADIETRLGFSVDNSAVQGALSSESVTQSDIENGHYIGARLNIFRINWQNPLIYAHIWKGNLGDIRLRDGYFEAETLGVAAVLQRATGRVYSRQCDAVFGDEACGVNVQNYPEGTQCPHVFEACVDLFANGVNFQGFPYLIGDDALTIGPRNDTLNDGASRYTTTR